MFNKKAEAISTVVKKKIVEKSILQAIEKRTNWNSLDPTLGTKETSILGPSKKNADVKHQAELIVRGFAIFHLAGRPKGWDN